MTKDYYKILGVNKNVSDEELKSTYKQLVKKYHPDISKEPNAEEKLKEITEAYSILSNPDKRKHYDMFGEEGIKSGYSQGYSGRGFSFDFSDLFSQFADEDDSFFSQFSNFKNRSSSYEDLNLKTKINIDFVTAVKGGKVDVNIYKDVSCSECEGTGSKSKSKSTCSSCNGKGRTYTKKQTPFGVFAMEQTCSKCNGNGTTIFDPCRVCSGRSYVKKETVLNVAVPAGINTGDIIRIQNQGNSSNSRTGDLFISIFVSEHDFFKREGFDLYCEVPIIYSDLVLGTKIKIKGIQDTIKLTIPANTKPETMFKISGKGVADPNRGKVHGSLYIKVILATPTDINREYKSVLEKLSTLDSKNKKKIQEKFKSYVEF